MMCWNFEVGIAYTTGRGAHV